MIINKGGIFMVRGSEEMFTFFSLIIRNYSIICTYVSNPSLFIKVKFPTLSFFLAKIYSPDCHVLSVACRWWANYAFANKSTASLLFAYTVFWDYYFLLCHRYNEIRVRYYYMLFVDIRMRRGTLAGEGCFINAVFILLVS